MSVALPPETEAGFMRAVIDAAHVFSWAVAHFRPALTRHGWRTPVQADGAGWPDLVLVRERVVFAELKAHRGRLSVAQKEWVGRLRTAGGEVYVWDPSQWDDVLDVLRRREVASP
jgi:hypothetical protein